MRHGGIKRTVATVLALSTVWVVATTSHAGCGGGGYGGFRFGRSYSAPAAGCGGGCNMNIAGMSMPGMAMPAMNMALTPAYAPAPAASAAKPAASRYTCTMHPNVASATPGSCPICGMALTPRK